MNTVLRIAARLAVLSAVAIPSVRKAGAGEAQVLEGESLKILKAAGNLGPQSLKAWGEDAWSGNAHLWWTGAKPGDVIELAIPVAVDGVYRIGAGMTKAIDYGIFEFAINGVKLPGAVDLFNDGVVHTGTLALGGPVKLAAGEHRLSVKVFGANPSAIKSHMLGLDYVVLATGENSDVTKLGPKLAAAKLPKPAGRKAGLKEGNADIAVAKPAAEQRALFTMPDDFEIELVGSEEQGFAKPVMTAFDNAGRMWTATATAYPCDNDPAIWKQPGKDRVLILDHPTARTPQTPRIFAEGMVMPLSVLPSGRGAYVAQGPEIFYLDDTDGDGRADSRKVLLRGFGVQDTHTLPHQLSHMPGGRVVYSQGVLNKGRVTDSGGKTVDFNKTLIATFRPDGTRHEIIGAGLNNIWCWAVSREGRVFIHEANDLGYSLVPFEEDSTYPSFIETKLYPGAPLHPPTAEGLNLGGTGFSGLAICDDRSGSFPAPWHGLMFVANPITGRINAVKMELAENGVFTFKKQPDLLSCKDPMFRPVAITFGPDGCLYITDWYNRIISHNEIARDHPARDKSHGRVWRVRHKSQPSRTIPDMTKVPAGQLPQHLAADNTWEMRAAWREIASRGGKEIWPPIVAMIRNSSIGDDVKIHALWALEDSGYFDAGLWKELLASGNPNVRREAVRSLSSMKVSAKEALVLLQPLAAETAWTVRYEVLRFLRRSAVTPDLAWLAPWTPSTADTTKVKGWNGTYFALGGAYERAFQDFLFALIASKGKTQPTIDDTRFDAVIATQPARGAEESAAIEKRIRAVKANVSAAGDRPFEEGERFVKTLCLSCHVIAGKGVALAPPLDGSSSRDVDALITAILDPDAAVENVFRLYRVETNDGGRFEGFKKSVDLQNVTLMSMGGSAETIPISTIQRAGYVQGRSTMLPIGAGLSDQQIADIVRFLRTVK